MGFINIVFRMKEALNIIKNKRPCIDPNIGFIGQLQILEKEQINTGKKFF